MAPIMVVPNSTLNKETIVNFSRPRPHRMEMIDIDFSYEDPPYKVRQALDRADAGTPRASWRSRRRLQRRSATATTASSTA